MVVFPSSKIHCISVNSARGLLMCSSNRGDEVRVYRCKNKPFLVHKISMGTVSKIWKKLFSLSVRHTYVITADIVVFLFNDYRFRVVDFGSIVGKNFRLFSSYDYAAFEFRPGLPGDFFYARNELNPFHKNFNEELASAFAAEEGSGKSSKRSNMGAHTATIVEETESEGERSPNEEPKLDISEMFALPNVTSKVEMDPHDPVEIGLVKIWIMHLDGFVYRIDYHRTRKEFYFRDERTNWLHVYSSSRRKRTMLNKAKKTQLKVRSIMDKKEDEATSLKDSAENEDQDLLAASNRLYKSEGIIRPFTIYYLELE